MRVIRISMNRFTKKITADLWLNLVIIVLLIALFFQCALYLSEYAHRNGDSGDVPFEMQMLSTSATGSLRGIDGSMLSPSLVAVSSEGKASAVMNSAAVMDEIYTEIGHCLFDALAKEAISVSEEDWRMAAREDSFVYVLYPGEMPYQVVFAFAAAKEASDQTLRRADGYVGIREILLIPDASGDLTHMLVRGREGVFAYTLGNTVPMSVFADYSLLYPDIFYRGCFHVREYETEFVIDEKISSRVIYASEGSAALLRSNNDHMDVLFRLLNFNPDKLRYHTEEDGANVYVESHGILRIDSRSIVYTSAEQGGIQLSKVIGQGVKGEIYTYLQTASYIIRRLSSMDVQYTGGDAAE